MAEDKHGVAIIGAGAVVEHRHLPGLAKSGRGTPLSIYDPDRARAKALAEKFSIPLVAESLEQAVGVDGAGTAVIASPNAYHREGVERALDAGLHVFCEKPIALTLSDARAMTAATGRAGRLLFVGFHHRFSSEHACVRRVLETGFLGEVRAFHSLVSEPIDVIPQGSRNYRFQRGQGGGLTLIDVGSHRIDEIRDLLGEAEEIYAEMASVLDSHDLDDSVIVHARMAGGALGSFHFHRFSRAFLTPCALLGTRGTLNFTAQITNPYQSAPLSLYCERAPEELPPDLLALTRPERWWGEGNPGWINFWPPRRDTFEEQYRAFFDSLEQGEDARPGGEDGYRALEIVLAAYLSLAERRPVRLPLDPAVEIPPPRFD